ncbi:MAG: hypothetical protein ACYSWU_03915 [Planctomycetota bacterium]|jgi:hypothetical protein
MKTRTFIDRDVKRHLRAGVLLALGAALLLGMPSRCLADDENPNPGVLPINAHAFGTTYEELAAEWWIWGLGAPADQNPILDPDGGFAGVDQSGNVWFLAGTFGGHADRTCTVPAGKAIFIPLMNTIWIATEPDETEEEMREGANGAMDAVTELECTVDGKPLQDLFGYRAESPAFTLSVAEGSLASWFLPVGEYYPSVAAGYWVLLAPLSEGEHVIEFRGASGEPGDPDYWEVSVDYTLTVGADDEQ